LIKDKYKKLNNSLIRGGRRKNSLNFFLDIKLKLKINGIKNVVNYLKEIILYLIPNIFLIKMRQGSSNKYMPMPLKESKKGLFIFK